MEGNVVPESSPEPQCERCEVLELQLNEGEKRCNELVCKLEVLDERYKCLKSEETKFKRLELALEK